MLRSPIRLHRGLNIALIITSGRASNAPRSSCLFIRRCWPLSNRFTFDNYLFTTYNLAAPSFLVRPKTAELHIRPPTLAIYRWNSVYCLLSYVVDPISPLLRSVSFLRSGTLDVSPPPVAPFHMFLFSVGIYFGLYTHIRDWTLFTKTGA